jgi:Alpha-L-arabinofuranosidase B, catalytic/NPCBM-associated, NEW3 domain of alpha-galactosidase
MKPRLTLALMAALATLAGAAWTMAAHAGSGRAAPPPRPEGPCDVYAAAGDPCVAAHSTTRALYAAYDGPLYQVLRQSDGRTRDIGVVSAGADGGGYADAAAQDAFCASTFCWVSKIYDQSGHKNDLTQAPRGGFSGPAMGGFNNLPIADMAPVTIMGHKVYGVFIEPGMGLRTDDPTGTAVDDQAEGQYWVINGHHYNSGCCFDYGNAETDSRDDGNGTMETAYYGSAGAWYHGPPPGPWVMTDQENNLVGCVNSDPSKGCPDLPNINWRFVTAMAKGEPHHWTSLGGDAQQGPLRVMFDGPRVNATYDPMRKQGAILLGNGGDNSNGSQGTFYEGAMTAGGTFPTNATDQLVQANIVAAKYDVAPVSLDASLQTFSRGSSHETTLTFTNTTGAAVAGVELSLAVPARWSAVVRGTTRSTDTVAGPVAPGATASATFTITSGPAAWNGDLVASARWTDPTGVKHVETTAEKARNVGPVRINEFQVGAGAPVNATNAFVELYNAGTAPVDLSNWTLTVHPIQQAIFSDVAIPAGTRLAGGGFYLLGLANSGLAAPARKGETALNVRSTTDMAAGDAIDIGAGADRETRTVAAIGTPAGNSTTLWQPLPDGPVITIPAGSTSVPVTSVEGFVVGEKIALGYGATYPVVARTTETYEVATVTAVGKPGTQGRLAAAAPAGSTGLKVTALDNISVGDRIRLDIASRGHGIEWVTVTAVGTRGPDGTGLTIAAPLTFDHAANMPFSDRGTGIGFTPATAFAHSSNEPVQALGTGITLDRPLANDHAIDAVVRDARVTTAGYQGAKTPNQWFGGPGLSASAGSLVLRDAGGLVVDSLNYGGLVDPWAAEGDQSVSGTGQSGCRAPVPGVGGRGFGRGRGAGRGGVNRSAGRFPDGHDTDSNCTDFLTQTATTMPAASAAGATNIKVAGVADFAAGQTVTIDTGADAETAVIAAVGTAGATTMEADAAPGATEITVANPFGFSAGQTITIDSGAHAETAVVSSARGGRRGGRGGRGGAPGAATITVAAPLAFAHAAGAEVSGTGMTLTAPLTRAHAIGTPFTTGVPTPGGPNRYIR